MNALEQTKGVLTRKKIVQVAFIVIFVLTGCRKVSAPTEHAITENPLIPLVTETARSTSIIPTNESLPLVTASEIESDTVATATSEVRVRGIHEVTALIEAMQAATQGAIVLDPDRDYDGQVEIDPVAANEYYDYLLNAIVMANPEYFELLTEQSGMQFQSGEDLINYLSENDWILPLIDGKCIRLIKSGNEQNDSVLRTWYLDKPVSLKNLGLMFFSKEEYREVLENYDENPVIESGRTILLITGQPEFVGMGIGTHTAKVDVKEYYLLSLQISDRSMIEDNPWGFPQGGILSDEDVNHLNNYITFLAYSFRIFKPPVDIIKQLGDMGGRQCYENVGCANDDGIVDRFYTHVIYPRYPDATDRAPYILLLNK